MNEEYDLSKPDIDWVRHDGSHIRFYRSKKDPHKYKCTINHKDYDPTSMIDKATNEKPKK